MLLSRRLSSLVLVIGAVGVGAACGGSDTGDLFGGGGGDGGASTGGDGASSSPTDGGTTSGDGAIPGDSGDPKVTDSGRADAAPPGDDGGKVTADPGISCSSNGGSPYCDPANNQFCCVTQGAVTTYGCVSSGGLCPTGIKVSCDDTTDCRGQVCCGQYDTSANEFTVVRCQTQCGGTASTVGVRFCDPNANDCPGGRACVTSQRLPPYHICAQ